MTDRIIIADASKISGAEFFRSIFGDNREKRDREMREQCIRAIRNGDTYGWPPAMVEACREEAEQQTVPLPHIERDAA